MYIVDEISKLLGVSDKTIYRYLRKHKKTLEKEIRKNENNKKAITKKGLEQLAKLEGKKIKWPEIKRKEKSKQVHEEKYYIKLLESQVKDLKDKIAEVKKDKNNQIEDLKADKDNLIKLLDQQQQLHQQLQNNIKLLEVNADKQKEQVKKTPTAEYRNEPKGLFDKLKDIFK